MSYFSLCHWFLVTCIISKVIQYMSLKLFGILLALIIFLFCVSHVGKPLCWSPFGPWLCLLCKIIILPIITKSDVFQFDFILSGTFIFVIVRIVFWVCAVFSPMKIHLLSESSWHMYQMGQVYLKEVVSSKMFSLEQYEILIRNKKYS